MEFIYTCIYIYIYVCISISPLGYNGWCGTPSDNQQTLALKKQQLHVELKLAICCCCCCCAAAACMIRIHKVANPPTSLCDKI